MYKDDAISVQNGYMDIINCQKDGWISNIQV